MWIARIRYFAVEGKNGFKGIIRIFLQIEDIVAVINIQIFHPQTRVEIIGGLFACLQIPVQLFGQFFLF